MMLRACLVSGLSTLGALLVACGGSSAVDPPLSVETAKLDAALKCTPFEHPERNPVLLVHGTITTGFEQWELTYIPLLVARGFDVCAVTYPDRGSIDQQISAEYVAHALRSIAAQTGRQVDMIGHSQGASMPRWALKFWPTAREVVDDFVLLAGPNHGTSVSLPFAIAAEALDVLGLAEFPVGLLPEAFYQFAPGSQFTAAVNRGDETPGDIDYTSLYTLFDELVQPVFPVPTAALDFGQDNPRVTNLLLQDLCPGRFVDHFTIGLTDRLTFELALDAIDNPGPANIERAGGATELCGLLPIIPDQIIAPQAALNLISVLRQELENGLPAPNLANAEPPLRDYAR
jgi:hypothetical protein